tara:strand:- start:2742 stop:2993 length:252 start_codon:yes stop_codon:yes gene_type:complete
MQRTLPNVSQSQAVQLGLPCGVQSAAELTTGTDRNIIRTAMENGGEEIGKFEDALMIASLDVSRVRRKFVKPKKNVRFFDIVM